MQVSNLFGSLFLFTFVYFYIFHILKYEFLIYKGHLCAECGKSFKTIHLLASHQMLHTTEKPFACELCPSRFKWKAALKTHMLVHTGQKHHVCDLCGSSFTTKGSMKKHKRKTINFVCRIKQYP